MSRFYFYQSFPEIMTKFALHSCFGTTLNFTKDIKSPFSSNLICICLLVNILQLLYCSEEAQEGSNQDIKDFQLDHSRQMGFETRNLDTFHRLLDRSDPKVVATYDPIPKSDEPYPPRVVGWCCTDDCTHPGVNAGVNAPTVIAPGVNAPGVRVPVLNPPV